MIIGIDASRSRDSLQKTGVEVISDELLRAMNQQLQDSYDEIRYYTPEVITWLPDKQQRVISFPRLWTVVRLSLEMLGNRPDVFFSPVHELPFFCPAKTYRVIHDVAFLRTPEVYSGFQNWYLRFGLKRSLRVCEKIFVPTNQVKQDLLELAKAPAEKIIVTGFGYERKAGKVSEVVQKKRQLLFIGRVEAKKNISTLLLAFELFAQKNPEYTLVIAGKPGNGYESIQKTYSELDGEIKKKIRFMGYVTDEQKLQLFAESVALVHVAREEGFGIPLLEGFDFELPVIASDIPVLREIGGGACMYTDPNNAGDIARSIEQVVSDTALTRRMKEQGRRQLEQYSWQLVVQKINLM